jgi:release factor glutamine methyltransferase
MKQPSSKTMTSYPKIATIKGVYAPREDSYLLAEAVEKYAFGKMLDMGTGSGIAGITGALKGCDVTFCDIDSNAVSCAKANAEANGIAGKFVVSDIFSKINGSFNTIAFNPPYLNSESLGNDKVVDRTLDGGAEGREVIDRFLNEAASHLLDEHVILLLESSLNGYENDVVRLGAEVVCRMRLFFEELVVLRIK